MGLDSIELLMEIENFFGIEIDDREAEKIVTVQNMVDSVANHLNISNETSSVKEQVFAEFSQYKSEADFTEKSSVQLLSAYVDFENKAEIKSLSNYLELKIPIPFTNSFSPIKKAFHFVKWQAQYKLEELTVEQFIIAVCAENYEQLIQLESLNNKTDILIGIIGITSEKLGVDIYEVQPEKKFVDDFGIN